MLLPPNIYVIASLLFSFWGQKIITAYYSDTYIFTLKFTYLKAFCSFLNNNPAITLFSTQSMDYINNKMADSDCTHKYLKLQMMRSINQKYKSMEKREAYQQTPFYERK